MCHSLNLEHSEDIDYLTLSLREQMIVSHEYGSSLGELLLIQGSMGKFVKFLVQFKKKKERKKRKEKKRKLVQPSWELVSLVK